MPTKKKAKGKTKAKRKRPAVTKATTRRKTAARKKPAKKALVRRSSAKKATPAGNARSNRGRPARQQSHRCPACPRSPLRRGSVSGL